ncbi:olfactory receptor 5V1-like [Lissotriton helveticus]
MEHSNDTVITEFIMLGFSKLLRFQTLLFALFLLIYSLTLTGNIGIILVVLLDSHLHKPMYFFLCNLSFLDICYTSTTVPKMLELLLSQRKSMSYAGCVLQLYFFFSFVGSECILLSAMSYDRYVAICLPLRYPTIMNQRVCLQLAAASWGSGLLNSIIHTCLAFQLPFCGLNEIDYFFCDIPPLLSLACGDTTLNVVMLLVIGVFIAMTPFMCIIVSYMYIISSLLKIRSTNGRWKASSTCASHIIVVLLYYGSSIFTYTQPFSSYSLDKNHLLSICYSIITPMLNPLIYTLKNQEVKRAAKKKLIRTKNLSTQIWISLDGLCSILLPLTEYLNNTFIFSLDTKSATQLDSIDNLDLKQIVTRTSHITRHTLNSIFTSSDKIWFSHKTKLTWTDHSIVHITIAVTRQATAIPTPTTCCSWNTITESQWTTTLKTISLQTSDNVNQAATHLYEWITTSANSIALIKILSNRRTNKHGHW